MSKITIETRIQFSDSGNFCGWAYRISKGRRKYEDSGVFKNVGSKVESEILVFKRMCAYLHRNIQFDEDTKITIISECRELIRLMRYGSLAEVDRITSPEVEKAFNDLLKFRNTKARCVYRFISSDRQEKLDKDLLILVEKAIKDEKKDGAKENCSARR